LIANTIKRKLTAHLFQQNEWLKNDFSKHKSKSILFNVGPIHYALKINDAGIPEYIEYLETYDAEIKLTISSAIELMRGNKKAYIEIKGDINFATMISNALKDIEWDYEDDLSKIIGDIPAYQLVKLGKKFLKAQKKHHSILQIPLESIGLKRSHLLLKNELLSNSIKKLIV